MKMIKSILFCIFIRVIFLRKPALFTNSTPKGRWFIFKDERSAVRRERAGPVLRPTPPSVLAELNMLTSAFFRYKRARQRDTTIFTPCPAFALNALLQDQTQVWILPTTTLRLQRKSQLQATKSLSTTIWSWTKKSASSPQSYSQSSRHTYWAVNPARALRHTQVPSFHHRRHHLHRWRGPHR